MVATGIELQPRGERAQVVELTQLREVFAQCIAGLARKASFAAIAKLLHAVGFVERLMDGAARMLATNGKFSPVF